MTGLIKRTGFSAIAGWILLAAGGDSAFAAVIGVVTDDDLTLTVTSQETLNHGITNTYTTVSISIVDDNVAFTAGDQFTLSVLEIDGGGFDDTIFSNTYTITGSELTAGAINRNIGITFDPSVFEPVNNSHFELQVQVDVTKDACGVFCLNDSAAIDQSLTLIGGSSGPGGTQGTTASDTDDDATVTLQMSDPLVRGQNQVWGTVSVLIIDDDTSWTAGDSVLLEVYENDLIGDDLLFSQTLFLTAAELASGVMDRSFDLAFDPFTFDEGDNFLEFFASATVSKLACGVLSCSADAPQTQSVSVSIVDGQQSDSVPAPAALGFLSFGLTGLGLARRRRSA